MNREFDSGLVAPSDIAVLAGVTRAAVSNWRKRRSDFPPAVAGTTANPLFDHAAIEEWLNHNGHPVGQGSAEMTAWSIMNKYRGQLSAEAMVATAHALLCARKLFDGSPRWAQMIAAENHGRLIDRIARFVDVESELTTLLQMPSGPPQNLELLDSFASELLPVIVGLKLSELPEFSDRIIAKASSPEGRTGGEYGEIGSPGSALLARCVAGVDGIVYDPACGFGETLITISKAKNATNVNLVGHDDDAAAVLLARQRCFLHDVAASISKADVLKSDPDPELRADAIVANLPLSPTGDREVAIIDPRWAIAGPPPPKSPEYAWLQHVISHLTPHGRGYILANPATTFALKSAKMRRLLVHAGCIEAVIGLPAKTIPFSGIPPVLWVLCRPGASRIPSSVLVIDASGLSPSDELPITDWLDSPSILDSTDASWITVPVSDVLADDEASLSPRGLTESKVDKRDIAQRYAKARSDLAATSRVMTLIDLTADGEPLPTSYVATIRQLERQGSVDIVRSRERNNTEAADRGASNPPIITTEMVRDGLPPLPACHAMPVDSAKDLTQPGDVLVTTTRALHASIDETGGRSIKSGVTRLRIDRSQFDPRFIAACVTAGWNQRFEMGFYAPQANIRDLEIPIIPLADQEYVVRTVQQARAVREAATLAASAATELAEALLESVRFNVDIAAGPD